MRKEVKVCVFGLLLTLLLGSILLLLGTATTLPGPDSKETLLRTEGEIISMAHGLYRTDTFVGILGHTNHQVTDSSFVEARESLVDILKAATDDHDAPLFGSVKTLGHSWAQEDLFVSKDHHHLLILAESNEPIFQSPQTMKNLVYVIEKWNKQNSSFSLHYLSSGIINNELFSLINNDLDTSLTYTVPITLCILLWTFGSIGASLLATFVTGLSLISSLGIASLLSQFVHPVSATAAQLVVLIVMAIGTDYALFYIARVRQELSLGAGIRAALAKTSQTTGVAILWSGVTVAASLTGLLLVNDPILTSMAAISIIAVLVTLIYTLQLLPALLIIFERWIGWGAIRNTAPPSDARQHSWVMRSVQQPLFALLMSVICLLCLGYFCFHLNLGSTMQAKLMPQKMQSSQAVEAIDKYFPNFSGTDLTIILHAKDLGNREANDELEPFFDRLQQQERMHGPIAIHWSSDKTTVRYDFMVPGTSQDQDNRQLIETLTHSVVAGQLKELGIQGFVTGKLVFDIDQEVFHKKKIIVVLGSILGVSLIFLMIAFESIVIPIKAFLLNILSAAAAFGVLVLLFQLYGWKYGVVESFVPSLLFSILFGLSMDYHLLLISRIQEYVIAGFQTRQAVMRAISETYGVITGAAIIMTSVFVVISLLELPLMKQLGIGLACAVVLDATIIRCVLLPASVILLGEKNWYMPKSLKKVVQRSKSFF